MKCVGSKPEKSKVQANKSEYKGGKTDLSLALSKHTVTPNTFEKSGLGMVKLVKK